eukprot:2880-Heterococcus_DN1.PRE.2
MMRFVGSSSQRGRSTTFTSDQHFSRETLEVRGLTRQLGGTEVLYLSQAAAMFVRITEEDDKADCWLVTRCYGMLPHDVLIYGVLWCCAPDNRLLWLITDGASTKSYSISRYQQNCRWCRYM